MSSLIIERKVEGGKLFRLRVTRSRGAFSVRLTGDFFLEPEEGIEIVEATSADCLASRTGMRQFEGCQIRYRTPICR